MPKGSFRPLCSIDGCDEPHSARGWCVKHYGNWKRHGDPLVRPPRKLRPAEDRFWVKVEKTGLCWEWRGTHNAYGYGTIYANGRQQQAHRFAYELLVGLIPEGLQIDHICRNPNCVRPSHLEPVTQAENKRRGLAGELNGRRLRAQNQCKRGHPYNEINTKFRADGRRQCLICCNITRRERRRARREAA